MSLFPLDTIKTRLQSQQGFLKAGGFKGIYKGLGPQAIGSVPTGWYFYFIVENLCRFYRKVERSCLNIQK